MGLCRQPCRRVLQHTARLHRFAASHEPTQPGSHKGSLEATGAIVDPPPAADQAIEQLTHQSFDAVLMDIHARQNGLHGRDPSASRAGRLADHCVERQRPEGTWEYCLAMGMNGYVTKPIDPNTLNAGDHLCRSAGKPARSLRRRNSPIRVWSRHLSRALPQCSRPDLDTGLGNTMDGRTFTFA